jgi:hypothetical protein
VCSDCTFNVVNEKRIAEAHLKIGNHIENKE